MVSRPTTTRALYTSSPSALTCSLSDAASFSSFAKVQVARPDARQLAPLHRPPGDLADHRCHVVGAHHCDSSLPHTQHHCDSSPSLRTIDAFSYVPACTSVSPLVRAFTNVCQRVPTCFLAWLWGCFSNVLDDTGGVHQTGHRMQQHSSRAVRPRQRRRNGCS